MELTKREQKLRDEIIGKIQRHYGKTLEDASENMIYNAAALTVRDIIMEKWQYSHKKVKEDELKKLYYLSFEFLMGRALGNNMLNLFMVEEYKNVFKSLGIDIERVEDLEPDAGLGNGGLGRLAACFLDSLTTLDLPAYGASIRYEYGLFRQKIVEGFQYELPDNWLENGNPWEICRPEEQVEVKFGGHVDCEWWDGKAYFRYHNTHTVIAVPYDMPVCGYGSKMINKLRLWSAKAPERFDMKLFNEGSYIRATEEREMAELISKVLYPEDNHFEGKSLRLKQQYFLVSATMQWIIKDFKYRYKSDWSIFPNKVTVHINDTHPTLSILELMRILMDDEGLSWDDAWGICTKVFAYTNHTVMSEALEKWDVDMFKSLLPRIYMIAEEINKRNNEYLYSIYPEDHAKINYMAVISNGKVNMANLCLATCYSINGVSELHTEILKNEVFSDYFRLNPKRFHAITNGVTFRRWIKYANPNLSALIEEKLGEDVSKNYEKLKDLKEFSEDKAFLEAVSKIKRKNKEELAKYIEKANGIKVNVDSIFDVQAKRLHEYKRQLLNVLHILYLYNKILENPNIDMVPRTFIFAAKAAPGYARAKLIIKLINSVADLVNNDSRVGDKIKVVFLENYGVKLAEKIVTAADVSEQISTAGKEASGTGNMKFMLNGALTVGTFDGANVEMSQHVGMENIYIFGLRANEVSAHHNFGSSEVQDIYAKNAGFRKVMELLMNSPELCRENPQIFKDLYNSIMFGDYGYADPYMVARDFEAYVAIQEKIDREYQNQDLWLKKSVLNISAAWYFSSDRAIKEYSDKIWHLTSLEQKD